MKKNVKIFLGTFGTFIFALILGIIGLLIGTNLGGNGIVNINFLGLVGYESAGSLFFLIGSILGIIIGTIVTYFVVKKK